MLCYSTASNQKLRKFLERIKMVFEESYTQHSDHPSNLRMGSCEKPRGDTLIIHFAELSDSIHREKMG